MRGKHYSGNTRCMLYQKAGCEWHNDTKWEHDYMGITADGNVDWPTSGWLLDGGGG